MNYDFTKLSAHIKDLSPLKVLVLGCGAVGSLAIEFFAKAGVGEIICIDMGSLDHDNAAKHSSMIRKEDADSYKAIACAERANGIMIAPNGKSYALVANVQSLGPRFYEAFDYVVLALDNYAAKEYVNLIWRQVKKDKRPKFLTGGTIEECTNVYFLTGDDICGRCLYDESWLNGDAAKKRTSCTDAAQYRISEDDLFEEHAPTSQLASVKCAGQMLDYIIASEKGKREIDNTMTYHYPYPNGYDVLKLKKKKDCPDCQLSDPPEVTILEGSMNDTTLGALKEMILKDLGTNSFSLLINAYEWAGVVYSQFIVADQCKVCGSPMFVNRHEYSIREGDIVCRTCQEKEWLPAKGDISELELLTAFTYADHRFDGKTLFGLGYPVGAYLTVMHDGVVRYYALESDTYKTYCKENDRKELKI